MQGDAARTTLLVLVIIDVCTALRIGLSVNRPCVGVTANSLGKLLLFPLLDGEVKGLGTRTTEKIGVFENVIAAFGVELSVRMPKIVVAALVGFFPDRSMIDVEVENLVDLTTCRCNMGSIVGTALGIFLSDRKSVV